MGTQKRKTSYGFDWILSHFLRMEISSSWMERIVLFGRRMYLSSVSNTLGQIVLRTTMSQEAMWQSFDQPIRSFLPGMKLLLNKKTGQRTRILSWKEADDYPNPGMFSAGIDPETPRHWSCGDDLDHSGETANGNQWSLQGCSNCKFAMQLCWLHYYHRQ